jgi:hypothetical protein
MFFLFFVIYCLFFALIFPVAAFEYVLNQCNKQCLENELYKLKELLAFRFSFALFITDLHF